MGLNCPKCGNTEDFLREFKAIERVWTDDEGLVVGFKDEETLEVTGIECYKCHHRGTPKEFDYEG